MGRFRFHMTSNSCEDGNHAAPSDPAQDAFRGALADAQNHGRTLLRCPVEEQKRRGYYHTLNEILQQPFTWLDTCSHLIASNPQLRRAVADVNGLVLTGSGSSEYAGECVRLTLQKELRVATDVIGGGVLITHRAAALPPGRPALMVSLARSGDSPESTGAVALALATEPGIRHLVITCNSGGALAATYRADPRVLVIVLDERTNDRSLVMTSSLTNIVLAARYLGLLLAPEAYRDMCERLSRACRELLLTSFDALHDAAAKQFRRVVFLGSGSRWGAARESALKMLEMTGGRVGTMAETYLGLRHGPMSYIGEDTLVVCFLSSDPVLRAYESDLLAELERKQIGLARLIVGDGIPPELALPNDTVIEVAGMRELGDENVPVLDVVVGQLLAFARSLREGLRPDSPSEDGVISRVVGSFAIHGHHSIAG